MTRFKVWRYQCDFCGKRGLSGGHMARHEKYCTANPERACRLHPRLCGETSKPVAELKAVLGSGPDHGMQALRKLADDCPMCILAAIRQSGIQKWDGDPESAPLDLGFDFKAELKAAWQTINDAEAAGDERHYYSYY